MNKTLIESPVKVTHTYTQKMVASSTRVFPLLCPVRELEWVKGWPLLKAYTKSGFAEQDCVFITKGEKEEDSIWMITRYDPAVHFVEMVKVTPGKTSCKLQIQLSETGLNSCDSTITYTYIALSREGKDFVNNFSTSDFESMMKDWEKSINEFLSKEM